MVYCSIVDVLDTCGVDKGRMIKLSRRLKNEGDVNILINKYITQSTEEIMKLMHHPIDVHRECHRMEEDIVGINMNRVYLGNYDETYNLADRHMQIFDVQNKVLQVHRVYIEGVRMLEDDDDYAWSHTPNNGYIDFVDALDDGVLVQVTYSYDPFEDDDTPANIQKACACLSGIEVVEFMKGVRQVDTQFDAQGDSMVPNPDRDALSITSSRLRKRYKEAMAAEGYGFEFTPIRG